MPGELAFTTPHESLRALNFPRRTTGKRCCQLLGGLLCGLCEVGRIYQWRGVAMCSRARSKNL
eukprot:7101922-Pyramimonas_sp.AAC.1